jgi:hypothetical protein
MPIPFRSLMLAALAIAIGASVTAASETRRFKSKAYDITTNLPDDLAREVADHMDAVHAEYTTRFRAYAKRNNEPLRLWVFADRDGYQRFLAEHEINAIGSAGMFFRSDDARGLTAYLEPRTKEGMLETLRHEGMHQFLYQRIGDNLPPWINEGMAEWFGYALETQRGFEMGLGDPRAIDRLQQRLDEGTLVSLEELLGLSQREWNERNRNGAHAGQYDAAWSVVHFLAFGENGRYAGLLDQLLRLFWQGVDSDRATAQVFGGDTATLNQKWHDYVRALQPDELYLAHDSLEVHAVVMWALRTKGINPKTPAEFDAALREHVEQLELPDTLMTSLGEQPVTLEPDAWWRTMPEAGRTGKRASLRFIPDRRGKEPPQIEIHGLKRRVMLVWNLGDYGVATPTVEYR